MPGLRIYNGYGPSEVNSVSVSFEISRIEDGRVEYYPIGKPHRTVRAFLVDDNERVIECADTIGELVLCGPQVMRGYIGDDTATRDAFLWLHGERFYRTGDLCTRNAEGDFVYCGRRDFEVKIAGRRINLLEISREINLLPGVCDALVSAMDLGSEKGIVAFCRVNTPEEHTDTSEWLDRMEAKFPAYMVPRHFGLYQTPPRVSSGKIDRAALVALLSSSLAKHTARFLYLDVDVNSFRPMGAVARAPRIREDRVYE
ncbi:MAG: AMP-binding protein [Myxococcales bacterium]